MELAAEKINELVNKLIVIKDGTNDCEDLTPDHMFLMECACNGLLVGQFENAFDALYKQVQTGYCKPWLHGIAELTLDHEGYVCWRGKRIEHFTPGNLIYSQEGWLLAREIACRCIAVEERGDTPDVQNVFWNWKESM